MTLYFDFNSAREKVSELFLSMSCFFWVCKRTTLCCCARILLCMGIRKQHSRSGKAMFYSTQRWTIRFFIPLFFVRHSAHFLMQGKHPLISTGNRGSLMLVCNGKF